MDLSCLSVSMLADPGADPRAVHPVPIDAACGDG
jgi:hypothetical protein